MKSFMKLTVIFTILLGGLCVCSCEKREFIWFFCNLVEEDMF